MQPSLPNSRSIPRFDPYRTTTRARVVPRAARSDSRVELFVGRGASRGKTVLRWALVVVAAGTVAALQPWKSIGAPHSSPVAEPVEAARSVTVERPARAAAASVVLPATIRPWQTTTLHARVSGYLAAWHRDMGSSVKAGDLLAEIDTPELDQELSQAKALALEGRAAAGQARAERVEAEADLKVAEAKLESARAETRLAKSQLARAEKLVASRVTTREEYETTLEQFETRTALVAASESDLARRRANLETRTAIIEAREATAASREANVERLRELQGFKRIVAPFDGVVTRRTAEVGLLVTAGQNPLFVVEDTSRVRVQIEVPQTYAAVTRTGADVTIALPESSAGSVASTITRIAESVESKSRTMLAEVELDNASRRFQPGSYARASLATPAESASWTIPTNTVSMRIDGPHVALVDSTHRIELRAVTLGRDLGNRIVVTQGIAGTERLIVNPADDFANGQPVEVREPAEGLAQK